MKKTFIIIMALTAILTLTTTVFSTGLNGDFNNDGDVDAEDLAVFSKNFGKVDGTCTDSDNCIPGYYCEKDIGDCNGSGECTLMPLVCTDNWDPVCGCDGNTYGNACEAAAAGVNVAYSGECLPKHCWGNDMCAKDEYCLFAPCAIETGVCEPRPEICPDLMDPVCGCDNHTYANDCVAALNGMSVDYRGPCKPNGCCLDLCGNGICDQIVCLSCGCPCPETPENCPQDCFMY